MGARILAPQITRAPMRYHESRGDILRAGKVHHPGAMYPYELSDGTTAAWSRLRDANIWAFKYLSEILKALIDRL